MDKATPTPSPASADSVMAKAMMLVGALDDSCEEATSLPFLEAVTALRAEVERLAAQAAPTSKMACEQIRAWHDAYPRMDIYAKPGTLVMFDGRGGYEGEQEAAKKLLTMRGVYAVERVDVFSSSSTVYLAGVKGRGFNTVMFSVAPEPVAAQSPAQAPVQPVSLTDVLQAAAPAEIADAQAPVVLAVQPEYCTACDMTSNDKQRCEDCPRRAIVRAAAEIGKAIP